jgi:O-antigen/teichoic acid export membrane protein
VSSLTKRAVILIACRVMNYGVLILSPIFLVRIFDMRSYGQYREFVIYAMLLSGIIGFGANTNLLFFIPKYPSKERQSVTGTALFILLTSIVGCVAILIAGDLIRGKASYDFVLPLVAYVFFFINLDFYEHYWLGKKRSDYVLYYSTARIAVRTIAVIVAAYATRNVWSVLWSMIAVEAAKCVFMLAIFRRSFVRALDGPLVREQLRFIIPIGSSAIITLVNSQLANFTISLKMGVESLALYSIGNHQIPVINIIRSSVMDVLFPEMTQTDDAGRLSLWRRANVVFCFLIFPVYAVFFYFAPTFIEILFTAKYLAAVPLFRIYLTVILLQCFEMGTPLRAINRNVYFIVGSAITLLVNIGFIVAFFGLLGFLTPGMAYILGEMSAVLYLGRMILGLYRLELRELFLWRKVLRIAGACVLSAPVLFASRLVGLAKVPEAVVLSIAYIAAYFAIIRSFRIEEVALLVEKARKRVLPGARRRPLS